MAFPTNTDADPDPTTQIPWPSKNGKQVRMQSPAPPTETSSTNGSQPPAPKKPAGKDVDPGRRRMSTMDLINLSISMAGAQVAWTVELGYDIVDYFALFWPSLSTGILC